jgi:hypothetical protein
MPSQLLPDAEQSVSSPPASECRIFERRSCELPTTCQPASALAMKEMRWTATISDISLGGVRIVLPRRFEKGTGLAVELPGTDDREGTVVFVKVVHVKSLGNGAWALGCRFLSELSDDQLQSLLTSTSHVLASSQQDSDGAEDVEEEVEEPAPIASLPTARFLSNVHLAIDTQSGSIVNCIIKRLNVTKCWPLTAGKILSLNGKTPDQTPWSVRIQITQCREHETGCELQGRIVGPAASSGVFRALGVK